MTLAIFCKNLLVMGANIKSTRHTKSCKTGAFAFETEKF